MLKKIMLVAVSTMFTVSIANATPMVEMTPATQADRVELNSDEMDTVNAAGGSYYYGYYYAPHSVANAASVATAAGGHNTLAATATSTLAIPYFAGSSSASYSESS